MVTHQYGSWPINKPGGILDFLYKEPDTVSIDESLGEPPVAVPGGSHFEPRRTAPDYDKF